MKTTEITVEYGLTVNLGDYSNARPQLRETVQLEEGEDPAAARAELLWRVRTTVEELADQALEAHDRPAQYSVEPRYDVVRRSYHGGAIIAIVPHGLDRWGMYQAVQRFRLAHAQRYAIDYRARSYSREDRPAQFFDTSVDGPDALLAALAEAEAADAAENARKEAERQARELAWQQRTAARDDEDDEEDEEG